TSPGSVVTVYYNGASSPDTNLINLFNAGVPVYVFITTAALVIGNGVQLVTGVGVGTPPGAGAQRCYFTFTANQVSHFQAHSGAAHYQMTIATVVTFVAVPNLLAGQSITITGATPTSWDNTWVVVQTLASGVYTISQTSMTTGTATYTWAW